MPTLTLSDATIVFEDQGAGPPILLVHGHPFNRSRWDPPVAMLRDRYRVVTPDLRGYGGSSVTEGAVPLERHAADLAALLDHLGLERVVLGGLSMGGQIALEFLWQYPERVSALLLADTFPYLDAPAQRQARFDTADRLEREGMAWYVDANLGKMVDPANLEAMPAVRDHVSGMMATTPPRGAAASLRGRAARRDYTPLLPQSPCQPS